MAKAGYVIRTPNPVALTAGVARTALFVVSNSSHGVDLKKFRVSFDGTTIGNTPVLVELTQCTGATNVTPGTGNTSVTPKQSYGQSISAGSFSAGAACNSEPTVQTTLDDWDQTPYSSLVMYDFPLGDTPDMPVSQGFCIRLTAPQAVNAKVSAWIERL